MNLDFIVKAIINYLDKHPEVLEEIVDKLIAELLKRLRAAVE